MTDPEREDLRGNLVPHLRGAQKRLQFRQTTLGDKADPENGERVAKGLDRALGRFNGGRCWRRRSASS